MTRLRRGYAGFGAQSGEAAKQRSRKAQPLMIIMMGLLSACSGQPPADTYTDHTGKTTLIQSDREQCVASCNATYSSCMDSFSARDNGGVIGPSGMFGGGADCRHDLKNCLPQCQGR